MRTERVITAASRALLLLALLALGGGLRAQANDDVGAAARGVVRLVTVSSAGGETRLGMGSGFAVTPTRIVTNAHVVADVASGGAGGGAGGFLGVIPSQGRQRFVGRVVAFSPALDLAVVAIDDGRLEPLALYGGAAGDGQTVAALGYPFAVDRATAAGPGDVIRPQSPVRTTGHVAGRRASAGFDAIVHDAALGRGNSGGPLVDECGRVVGVNSAVSVSEGVESTFGLALSARELQTFLAKADVTPTVVGTPCVPSAQAAQTAAALDRDEAAAADRQARSEAERTAATEAQRARIRDDVAAQRENALALAGVLFGLGVLADMGAMVLLLGKRRQLALIVGVIGGAFIIGAIVVFLMRPGPGAVDARLSQVTGRAAAQRPVPADTGTGARLCRFVPERSRVTVSLSADVPLDWGANGCVNGRTQYGENGARWSRSFVSNTEATATVQSYDPAQHRYLVERYLLGADAIEGARAIRSRYHNARCTADPDARRSVADMEGALRRLLPPEPNERLVYDCVAAR